MATINIDEPTKEALKKYCTRRQITQGNFVKFALDYFQQSGLDPASPPESVKAELAKIEKRISQSIAFQKTFERDHLLPLLEALTKTEGKINQHLSDLPKKLDNTLEGVAMLSKATSKLEQAMTGAIQKLYNDLNRLQGETKETAAKQHKELVTKLDIILEHGAAVGLTGNSINERYKKQKK